MTEPSPNTMPVQWIPMGFEVNDPNPDQRWTYCSDDLAAICSLRFVQPPASYNPRIGISNAPAQMMKLMSQPNTICMTLAMANMLTPLMSTVMKAKETADRARLGSPKRNFK